MATTHKKTSAKAERIIEAAAGILGEAAVAAGELKEHWHNVDAELSGKRGAKGSKAKKAKSR